MITISKNFTKLWAILSIMLFTSGFFYFFNLTTDFNLNFIDKSDISQDHEPNNVFKLELSDPSSLSTYSGVGKAQNVTEYGEGYFINNNINVSNNENASIIIPNDWEGNAILCNVTNIYEYGAMVMNQTFDNGIDQNRWNNSTTGNPTKFTVGHYDNPTGYNDSIYLKLEEDGGNWQDTSSLINYSFPLLRENIPYEDWYIKYSVKWIMSDNSWRDDLPAGSKYVMGLEFSYNDGSSVLLEFNLKRPAEIMNNTWYHIKMLDLISPLPELYGYDAPANVSIYFSFGVKNAAYSPVGSLTIYYDNISFEIQSIPKPSTIDLNITDNASGGLKNQPLQDFSNLFGKGQASLEGNWPGEAGGTTHEFSFSSNSTGNILINSDFFIKASSLGYTTTNIGSAGSEFSVKNDATTTWIMYVPVSIPGSYSTNYYLNISKPLNWNVTQVIDPYSNNKINEVIGVGIGNSTLTIPNNIITEGVWEIVAEAPNYVELANLFRKNASIWSENDTFHIFDKLKVNATIKTSSIPNIENTVGTLKIFSPNGSLWYQEENISVDINGNVESSEIALGVNNASTGKYSAQIIWHDHDINMSQVGFSLLHFNVIHKTNLTAIDPSFEQLAGEPLLLRVKFIDSDLNQSIPFATVTYSSTYGAFGTMVYLGSGVYFIDIDTSSLLLGNYYFSFNTSQHFYENQSVVNLIHLKIVAQPLALEVPHYALEGNANSIISCKINTTGSITGALIFPANISTDWFNPYNITDHSNGTYTLDFSTSNIPASGFLESYDIEIFANKTNYGSTNEFITLLVHPLPTLAAVNSSFISIYSNEIVNLKVNYTIEGSNELILGANCSVTWQGSYTINPLSDGFNIKLFTNGLLVDYYQALIKLEKVGFEDAFESTTIIIKEQEVNLTVSINSEGITENSLIDSYFQQTINISVRAFAVIDEEFLSGGSLTLLSNNYQKNLTELPSTYFTTSVILDGINFSVGINNIFLRFEQANYTSNIFSFQLFLSTQDVNLTVSLNSAGIIANSLIDSYFQQEINISVRAYAVLDLEFLSGGSLTLLRNNYQKNFTELPSSYFTISLILDGNNFSTGINNIFLRFEQANYTTINFPFQLFISAQNVNLTTRINHQEVHEGYLLEVSFNHEFHISCRAFVDIESVFLSGGNITFVNGVYEFELSENLDYWFNQTILISTSSFSIGPNYVYLRFQQNNYSTTIFGFQVFVNQLEINVDTIDFEGLISGPPGETILIRLNLTETGSSNSIENATIFYSWNFGAGYFNYVGSGVYELELSLPSGFGGNYNFELVISKEEIIYETKVFSFIVDINQVEVPNLLIWIIIFSLIAISGILGVLSLRSYVILPKRREREANLMSKIQVFKDVWNIRAVILIQRDSGLPVYSEEISMDKDQDSFLISGFIQAITAFSETFVEREFKGSTKLVSEYEYLKTIIDLDFKFFQLLVCDYETIRVLLVLREESSELLKKQLYLLAVSINSQFSEELRNFSGNLDSISKELGELLNQFLFLHYNRTFEVTSNKNYLDSVLESGELTKLEIRLINVISSMTKINKMFTLRAVIDLIEEKNEDLVLEALNSLILRKVIISPYSSAIKSKNGANFKKTSLKKK